MKRISLLLLIVLTGFSATACPLCRQQQPRLLRGITHGAVPESNWDYLIIAVAAAIVVFTLFLSVKWLVRPGEKSSSHIKHLILKQE